MTHKSAGIYIHVPFCIKKCNYCDFYSITDLRLIKKYVNAILAEIKLSPHKPYCFDSIYFGGGTPSLLPPQCVNDIINTLVKQFHFGPDIEITLEANPKTLDLEHLITFKTAGINRIQLGVQSFSDRHLNFLGRIHSVGDAMNTIKGIRQAGFYNMGIDLIYGLPQQTPAKWNDELKRAVSLSPEHLSCYMLTYEQGTPLEKEWKNRKFEALSDEKVAGLFETTVNTLSANGYFQYEISNFTKVIEKPDGTQDIFTYRSRHNQKYWDFAPYLGFGPSAHSFEPPIRYWNVRNLHDYLEIIKANRQPLEDREVLSKDQQIMEVISLRLRTGEGMDIENFEKEFEMSFYATFEPVVTSLIENDLLVLSSNHLIPTQKGMLVLNKIVELMVDVI